MSRQRTRRRRPKGPKAPARTTRPPRGKPAYRSYLERCQAAGRTPLGFPDFLQAARRYRLEYDQARREQNLSLVRELDDLLCEHTDTGVGGVGF